MLKFIDLSVGDRFTLIGSAQYPLLTKINDGQARWHSSHSIQNELPGEDSSLILDVDADEAVEYVPVVIR